MSEQLPILYQDEHLVAINKPSGLLVHRSEIDRHETRFALQLLRDQLGVKVFPLHRLDKPTSGVLVFALNPVIAKLMSESFTQHSLRKTYLAVVRGFAPAYVKVDHALREEMDDYTDKNADKNKPAQSAITEFTTLATTEIPYPVEKYSSTRYSLVECRPHTGRKHQIRRHLKHISHPIIGDAKHGKGIHNRFFKHQFDCEGLLLAATQLAFNHPIHNTELIITAPLEDKFAKILRRFDWHTKVPPAWLGITQ